MCGQTKLDKIRNIRNKVEVVSIKYKMRDARPRWIGHVRRITNAPLRYERITFLECRRDRSRLRKSWKEVISANLKNLALMEDLTQERDCGGL